MSMADMFADAEGKSREKGEVERFFANRVMFYDVTTLYFEADREDDLRKAASPKWKSLSRK